MNIKKIVFPIRKQYGLLYKKFNKIKNKKVLGLINHKYIEKDRAFYYGNRLKFVDSIKMESIPGTYEIILDYISKIGVKSNNYKILDFGCGQHQSKYLKEIHGNNVFSADIINFKCNNFIKINKISNKININSKEFDIIIASEILEHVESPFILLDELIRISNKYIIFSTPNPMSLISRKKFSKNGFLHWFEPLNFKYNKTPLFYWQIEEFLFKKKLKFKRYSNHSFFGLEGDDIKYGETFIYIVKK